jgi:DNA polymerase-3 subunit alpha
MNTFCKLKTEYSITKSTITVKEGIKIAKQLGYSAVILADDGNLFASLDFALEAVKNKIFPIIGVSIEVKFQNEIIPITLICKTKLGFQNLLALTYNHPHPTFTEITSYLKDVLLLIKTPNKDFLTECLKVVLKDDLYLEVSRLSNDLAEIKREEDLLNLALEFDISIIYSNDAYFQSPSMFEADDVLKCIGEGRFLLEEDRSKFFMHNYFKSPLELKELFTDLPEALETAELLRYKISFIPTSSKPLLPSFASDEKGMMEEKAKKGLEERIKTGEATGINAGFTREDYESRLQYEVEVISQMGFCGYFLIVSDFINWSKNNGIPVGPGRGSGAGSLVAFTLGITDIDPLYYGLLFERFLNPDRVSMPDFDIDFCPDGRGKVTEYVQNKYGNTNVAGIITFGRLQARAVLKDVGRVLQIPYFIVDKICKLIPFNPVAPVSLEKAIELDPELQKQKEEDETIARLIEFGLKLEGLIRHSSVHAAGVIIADRPLLQIVPLLKTEDGSLPVVGYHMKAAETAGLVKFDFLGLKTLTIVADVCKMIKNQLGVDVNISRISLNDEETFKLLRSGFTLGVFQLESLICRDAMKKMQIDRLEDIIALTSLNRPGPMENIPSFINRKLGKEVISYPHKLLEDLLKETYGIIIYQEQVIKIAQILAGYTLGQADLLRRAMGKKIQAEMDAQRSFFVEGAVKNGLEPNKASEIFDLVDKFAGYGFNKSHAAAYTVISYQTAYLKARFPVQFFVANLNMSVANTDDVNLFISDAKAMGIAVNLPCINSSHPLFTTDGKAIFYGLGALKSVGIGSMEEVIKIREEGGKFVDIFDFCKRVGSRNANKKQLESLTKSGAFDCLKVNRKQILESVEILTKFAQDSVEVDTSASLFGDEVSYNPKLKAVAEDFTEQENLMNEFDAIGFYLSFHPLRNYAEKLESGGFINSRDLEGELVGDKEKRFQMAGVVSIVKQRSGARGRFAFVYISDLSGMFEASIFKDELITKHREDLVIGKLLAVKVSASRQLDTGALRIIINEINPLEKALEKITIKKAKPEPIIDKPKASFIAPITQKDIYRERYLVLHGSNANYDLYKNIAVKFLAFKNTEGRTKVYIKTESFKIMLDGKYAITNDFIIELQSQGFGIFDEL